MVLVTSFWPDASWCKLLELVTVKFVIIPQGSKLYIGDFDKTPLPSPPWETKVSLIDSRNFHVPQDMLDKKVVRYLQKLSKDWGRIELEEEMAHYPLFNHTCQVLVSEKIPMLPLPRTRARTSTFALIA
jgi:hypothetical protein